MPFPNYHAARVKEPGQYDSFATKSIAPGITAVLGIKGGKSEVQSYRFNKNKFTVQEAKAWLKAHDISPIDFEPATDEEKANASKNPEAKEYRAEFPKDARMVDLPDGGLMVYAVPIMATGIWKDANYGTAVSYGRELLQRDFDKVVDNGLWDRHSHGLPRSIGDRVGETVNDRFENDAIVADLIIWGGTQKSKDSAWLVKNKKVNYVSAEVWTESEKWSEKLQAFEPASMRRGGTALVFKGACSKCKINNEAAEPDCEADMTITLADGAGTAPDAGRENEGDNDMEAKELEAKLDTTLKELSVEREASKKAMAELEALRKDYASTQATLKELGATVEKLAKAPAPQTDATIQERELEAPLDDGIVVDKAGRQVFRRLV